MTLLLLQPQELNKGELVDINEENGCERIEDVPEEMTKQNLHIKGTLR